MNRIVGVPSDGIKLSDNLSPHFGHCRYFIGIEINEGNNFKKAFTLPNEGHMGCMEPVINMKQRKVTDMILTGIGMRPFMGFQQVNINLYRGLKASIEENIRMLILGKLSSMSNASCGNDSNHIHTIYNNKKKLNLSKMR
ncbi:MAG: NifB/NifX family molybdenum-iron cluster-binding protein [Candidatus Hodarchaeota archaeon]